MLPELYKLLIESKVSGGIRSCSAVWHLRCVNSVPTELYLQCLLPTLEPDIVDTSFMTITAVRPRELSLRVPSSEDPVGIVLPA